MAEPMQASLGPLAGGVLHGLGCETARTACFNSFNEAIAKGCLVERSAISITSSITVGPYFFAIEMRTGNKTSLNIT